MSKLKLKKNYRPKNIVLLIMSLYMYACGANKLKLITDSDDGEKDIPSKELEKNLTEKNKNFGSNPTQNPFVVENNNEGNEKTKVNERENEEKKENNSPTQRNGLLNSETKPHFPNNEPKEQEQKQKINKGSYWNEQAVKGYISKLRNQGKKVRLVMGVQNNEEDLSTRFDETYIFLDKIHVDYILENRSIKCEYSGIYLLGLSKKLAGLLDEIIFDDSVMKYANISTGDLRLYYDMLRPGGKLIYRFFPTLAGIVRQHSQQMADKANEQNIKSSCLVVSWNTWSSDSNNFKDQTFLNKIFENNHKRLLETIFQKVEKVQKDLPFKTRYGMTEPIIIATKLEQHKTINGTKTEEI